MTLTIDQCKKNIAEHIPEAIYIAHLSTFLRGELLVYMVAYYDPKPTIKTKQVACFKSHIMIEGDSIP